MENRLLSVLCEIQRDKETNSLEKSEEALKTLQAVMSMILKRESCIMDPEKTLATQDSIT